jgi:hypothetical protein
LNTVAECKVDPSCYGAASLAGGLHSIVVLTDFASSAWTLSSKCGAVEVLPCSHGMAAAGPQRSRSVLIEEALLLERLARLADAPNVVFFRPNFLFLNPVADMWRNQYVPGSGSA